MSWLPRPVDGPRLTLHSPWLMQQASLVPSLCLSRAGWGSGPRAVSSLHAVLSNQGGQRLSHGHRPGSGRRAL